jgi:hypothetical protein
MPACCWCESHRIACANLAWTHITVHKNICLQGQTSGPLLVHPPCVLTW